MEILTYVTLMNLENIMLFKYFCYKKTNVVDSAICRKYPGGVEQNSWRQKAEWLLPEAGEGGHVKLLFNVYGVLVWEDEKVLKMDGGGDGSITMWIYLNVTVHLKLSKWCFMLYIFLPH